MKTDKHIFMIILFMSMSIQQFLQYKMQQNIVIRQLMEYSIIKSFDYKYPSIFIVNDILRAG